MTRFHTRYIFDSTATINMPDDYSLSGQSAMLFIGEDNPCSYQTAYISLHSAGALSISVWKQTMTEDILHATCDTVFASVYDEEHCELLRNDFIADGNNSYYVLECKLKDEFYNNKDGHYEYGDGSVIPNYCVFYKCLHNGILTGIDQWYDGPRDGLESFRKQAINIAESYKKTRL